jgi:hypothetical protein
VICKLTFTRLVQALDELVAIAKGFTEKLCSVWNWTTTVTSALGSAGKCGTKFVVR